MVGIDSPLEKILLALFLYLREVRGASHNPLIAILIRPTVSTFSFRSTSSTFKKTVAASPLICSPETSIFSVSVSLMASAIFSSQAKLFKLLRSHASIAGL